MRASRQTEWMSVWKGIAAALMLGGAGGAIAGNCPADVANLPAGEWCEVPNSHMRSVAFNWPTGVEFTQNGVGVAGVMSVWSGGAFDTKRNRLVVWGGGHSAYAGNELYAFDVNTLRWTRVNDPSIPVSSSQPYTPGGGPASRHSYDYIEYVPSLDRFCSFGVVGPYPMAGGEFSNTDCFNFDTLAWERKADTPSFGTGAISDVDPITGHVWVRGNNNGNSATGTLAEWDPARDVWTSRIPSESDRTMYSKTGAIDPVRRKFVAVGGGGVYVWNIGSSGAITRQDMTTAGATSIVDTGNPGLVYDPVTDRLVAWSGGANVYTLNLDTQVWSQISPVGSNSTTPTAAEGTGTFGRFRYIPSKNVFVVVNNVDENVFFYKLSASAGLPPPQTPAKPAVTVR